jgi:hypothetical protein
MNVVERADFNSLEDALVAADYGILYAYVASSKQEGWLPFAKPPALRWYEKLVLLDRDRSRDFLREAGADEPFAFLAVGLGFVVFVARNPDDLEDMRDLTRPWIEKMIQSFVEDGTLDPKTYKLP